MRRAARATLRHAADYFIRCHYDDQALVAMVGGERGGREERGAADRARRPRLPPLASQIGTEGSDHDYWGRPEDMKMYRQPISIDPSRPGSDLAGATAAMLAASSMNFEETDPEYALLLEAHAREIYLMGRRREGLYARNVPGVGNM